MNRIEPIRNIKAFTMIELMIAVSILAIIIAGMTVALQQQQRQFKMTKETADMDQTGRAALDFLATEIRNAGSRQGKTFAVQFFNGGSDGNNPCTADTNKAGSANSPPDCVTLYTWDITRGQNGDNLPSVPGVIETMQNDPLVVTLPPEWFPDGGNVLIGETEENPEILLGFRSRTALCSPDSNVNCSLEPERCTECSVIMRATVNGSNKTATIDSLDDIKAQNMPVSTFNGFSDFINGVVVNGVNYGFLPTFSSLPSEMTIVNAKTFWVDPQTKSLMLQQNGGQAHPIAGGANAPAIVDFQLVFNLQNSDGGITKVGVPLAANNNLYPDFSNATLKGREQDIRSVEIYLVVKSKQKPRRIEGGEFTQTIPAMADVLQRTIAAPSTTTNEPQEGYTYRILSATVYMRNHSREEFG
jgi:prepilin-type N-terminal cleavage/methylation domain-containing protein